MSANQKVAYDAIADMLHFQAVLVVSSMTSVCCPKLQHQHCLFLLALPFAAAQYSVP